LIELKWTLRNNFNLQLAIDFTTSVRLFKLLIKINELWIKQKSLCDKNLCFIFIRYITKSESHFRFSLFHILSVNIKSIDLSWIIFYQKRFLSFRLIFLIMSTSWIQFNCHAIRLSYNRKMHKVIDRFINFNYCNFK
jgi:hypothetical protein